MLVFLCGFMRGLGAVLLVASVLALSAQILVADGPGPGDPIMQCLTGQGVNCSTGCAPAAGGGCATGDEFCADTDKCNACTCQPHQSECKCL
jgi:hypothetical protein